MAHLIIQFLMNGKMHVHFVCDGSESEYTSSRKVFILGPRLEGERGGVTASFQFSSRGNRKVLKQLSGSRCFFNICSQFLESPWW